MRDIVLRTEGLGKRYVIGHHAGGDLRAAFGSRVRRLFNHRPERKDFWALRDVSFELERGEAVGVIGRNGAGKSTLLKIFSRITYPTTGRFELYGRVSSLLEVGTGFHSELTGRENIFLNGTILGMTRTEIKRKFDEIVAFSGVEKFIDTPVKHYSSGMKVRLAFSVAAHLEPDILIVDEVLAVGDAEFQKKCLGKMDQVRKSEGRTVLFVSHNMAAVELLCQKTIYMDSGEVKFIGPIDIGIDHYLRQQKRLSINGVQGDYIKRVVINKSEDGGIPLFRYGDDIVLDFYPTEHFKLQDHNIGCFIMDSSGNKIGAASTLMRFPEHRSNGAGMDDYIRFTLLAPPLVEGDYSIDVSVTNKMGGRIEYLPSVASFGFVATDFYGSGAKISSHLGKIYFNLETSLHTKKTSIS